MLTKVFACFGLVVLWLLLATGGSEADEPAPSAPDCRALITQQWQALEHGDYDAANKALDRARKDGCLQQPVASELCSIPADQEAIQGAKGNATLVNIARNQQRLLGCALQ
jgi:hypothetical protein